MRGYRKDLGDWGEDEAEKLLRRRGYRIIQRNFQARGGEIDIVASRKRVLVFVEVKTRSGMAYGSGLHAVTQSKKRRLIRAARQYLAHHRMQHAEVRFDVVALDIRCPGDSEIIENAISLHDLEQGG